MVVDFPGGARLVIFVLGQLLDGQESEICLQLVPGTKVEEYLVLE
jgi:hypothetical protein